MFDASYVDVDEWGAETARPRYGPWGFSRTDARFALHLPPQERYEGRFFHPIFAIPGNEHTVSSGFMPGTAGWIGLDHASGDDIVQCTHGQTAGRPDQE